MPRPHFHPTPSLFPWMSLPSVPIFLIKMASRHAGRCGRKEKSRTHLHRLWSNFWHNTQMQQLGVQRETSKGTAIGTKMAPAYANMGHLEGQLLRSVTLRPFSWLRFIDDIDMVAWPRDFNGLPQWGQQLPPKHKVYSWISKKQHMFLDTKSRLVGDTIQTNRYTPVIRTHNLPPKTLLQNCSLQPCTLPQMYLLWNEPLGETRLCGKARCKTCKKMITPHKSRNQPLGQSSSFSATPVLRWLMLSTL